MKSTATRRFWELFQALPSEVQDLVVKNYQLWRRNPHHPSLRFRLLRGSKDRFTIRVGDHYRALGRLAGEMMIWVWDRHALGLRPPDGLLSAKSTPAPEHPPGFRAGTGKVGGLGVAPPNAACRGGRLGQTEFADRIRRPGCEKYCTLMRTSRSQIAGNAIRTWRGPLKLGFVLLLLMCALLFSQGKQAPFDTAKCLATCNNRCTANLNSCRKAAKNDSAKLACQKSYDQCGSVCVNKACYAPAK